MTVVVVGSNPTLAAKNRRNKMAELKVIKKATPKKKVDEDLIELTIGGETLSLSKEALRDRRGIIKAVMNTIAPFVQKTLSKIIED